MQVLRLPRHVIPSWNCAVAIWEDVMHIMNDA